MALVSPSRVEVMLTGFNWYVDDSPNLSILSVPQIVTKTQMISDTGKAFENGQTLYGDN